APGSGWQDGSRNSRFGSGYGAEIAGALLALREQAGLLGRLGFGEAAGRPAGEMPFGEAGQRVDERRGLVQAIDVAEGLAAGPEEGVPAFDGDLLEGLEAVGDEAGTHHVDTAHARLRQLAQRRFGVGLQPLGAAETRLEGD